jgi:hypothetical protein
MKTLTVKDFTMETTFSAADFHDLGEAGLINEALHELFTSHTYTDKGVDYNLDKVVSLEVKVVPKNNRVSVLLYGKAELV